MAKTVQQQMIDGIQQMIVHRRDSLVKLSEVTPLDDDLKLLNNKRKGELNKQIKDCRVALRTISQMEVVEEFNPIGHLIERYNERISELHKEMDNWGRVSDKLRVKAKIDTLELVVDDLKGLYYEN